MLKHDFKILYCTSTVFLYWCKDCKEAPSRLKLNYEGSNVNVLLYIWLFFSTSPSVCSCGVHLDSTDDHTKQRHKTNELGADSHICLSKGQRTSSAISQYTVFRNDKMRPDIFFRLCLMYCYMYLIWIGPCIGNHFSYWLRLKIL